MLKKGKHLIKALKRENSHLSRVFNNGKDKDMDNKSQKQPQQRGIIITPEKNGLNIDSGIRQVLMSMLLKIHILQAIQQLSE